MASTARFGSVGDQSNRRGLEHMNQNLAGLYHQSVDEMMLKLKTELYNKKFDAEYAKHAHHPMSSWDARTYAFYNMFSQHYESNTGYTRGRFHLEDFLGEMDTDRKHDMMLAFINSKVTSSNVHHDILDSNFRDIPACYSYLQFQKDANLHDRLLAVDKVGKQTLNLDAYYNANVRPWYASNYVDNMARVEAPRPEERKKFLETYLQKHARENPLATTKLSDKLLYHAMDSVKREAVEDTVNKLNTVESLGKGKDYISYDDMVRQAQNTTFLKEGVVPKENIIEGGAASRMYNYPLSQNNYQGIKADVDGKRNSGRAGEGVTADAASMLHYHRMRNGFDESLAKYHKDVLSTGNSDKTVPKPYITRKDNIAGVDKPKAIKADDLLVFTKHIYPTINGKTTHSESHRSFMGQSHFRVLA